MKLEIHRDRHLKDQDSSIIFRNPKRRNSEKNIEWNVPEEDRNSDTNIFQLNGKSNKNDVFSILINFLGRYSIDYHNNDLATIHTFRNIPNVESRYISTMKLALTVQDTGIGISKKDQASLFKLFGKSSKDFLISKTG